MQNKFRRRFKAMLKIKLIKLDNFKDARGSLIKFYQNEFIRNYKVKESFYSFSKRNVFRGMHFQKYPYEVNKIVHCFQGEILDFIVDLRPKSKQFKKIFKYRLSSNKPSILFIPKGYAHGFFTTSKVSGVLYVYDKVYSKKYDTGFHYSSLNYFKKKIILSKKDSRLKFFNLHIQNLKTKK